MPRTPEQFIADHTAETRPLDKAIGLAYWDASLSGKPEDFEKVAALEKQSVAIYSRAEEYAELQAFMQEPALSDDPLIARQIDMLYRAYRGCQGDRQLLEQIVDLEAEMTRSFNTFRAEFRGEKRSNNDLEDILKNTRDSAEAREAWEALKQIGAMAAPKVRELVRLRNRHATNLGSPNYYAFSMELRELDIAWLFDLLAELERETTPLFAAMKRDLDTQLAREFGMNPAELRPWHYRNPFFQQMPRKETLNLDPIFADKDLEALTTQYYRGIGLDIEAILRRSDLYEREGKDQHAYCIGIENPDDVRVLCNLKPTARWMSTMLHEFGHAVYDAYVDPALPYILRGPAHTLSTEAIAMLNERFMRSAEFLSEIAGLPASEAERMEAELRRFQCHELLVFVRWVLVMTHFERAMYEDPEQDLNSLWWQYVERFQMLDGSQRRECPDWASKIHLACCPVYYQNYLLGEMNASQILAALRKSLDGQNQGAKFVDNPAVGLFLRERIFAPAATRNWNDRLREATGEPLNPRFFINDLGAV